MSSLRFETGVTWGMLGGSREPLRSDWGGHTRREQLEAHLAAAAYGQATLSTVDFMRLASELAQTEPRRALQLADGFLQERPGTWRRGHGPNDLIAIKELQATAMAQGVAPGDFGQYRNVLLAQPRLPVHVYQSAPAPAPDAYGDDRRGARLGHGFGSGDEGAWARRSPPRQLADASDEELLAELMRRRGGRF